MCRKSCWGSWTRHSDGRSHPKLSEAGAGDLIPSQPAAALSLWAGTEVLSSPGLLTSRTKVYLG